MSIDITACRFRVLLSVAYHEEIHLSFTLHPSHFSQATTTRWVIDH